MKAQLSMIKSSTIVAVVVSMSSLCALPAAAQSDKSLFDRLGGIYKVAAVVDHFSDALVKNSMVGKNSKNPALSKWHTKNLGRLPGLKFMRTLWVSSATGGPLSYVPTKPGGTNLGLEEAHREFKISSAEFDEVVAELGRTLDHFKVGKREKDEALAVFAAHKNEIVGGARKDIAAR